MKKRLACIIIVSLLILVLCSCHDPSLQFAPSGRENVFWVCEEWPAYMEEFDSIGYAMLDGQMQEVRFLFGYDLTMRVYLSSECVSGWFDEHVGEVIWYPDAAVFGKCRYRENIFTCTIKPDGTGKYNSQFSSLTFRCYEKDDLPDYDWLPKFDDSDTSNSDIETNNIWSNEYIEKSMRDFIC